MMFGRPSLGWAKAKLPARAKPASAEIADRIIAPPGVSARHSVHSSKDAIGASPAERSDASLSFQIGRSRAHEHVDAPHPLAVLRARRQRPRRRTAEQRYELAASHCPMPPVLPTERIAHLGTADCCIHPPGRNEMIAITPPKIFSKEVAQNRPPHLPRQQTPSPPKIVLRQISGDGAWMKS